jgi:hypothetical protein
MGQRQEIGLLQDRDNIRMKTTYDPTLSRLWRYQEMRNTRVGANQLT